VTRALAVAASADGDLFDLEATGLKAAGEVGVSYGGPDGEDAAGLERRLCSGEALEGIEAIIRCAREP
jgi:hypothetical protein